MRLNAWTGLAVVGSRIVTCGVGGHADYAGNEGYAWDLSVSSPGAPVMLNAPTPAAQVTYNAEYYADGRPTSSHTYYSLHGVESLNRVFRFGIGSAWGDGNFQRPNVDAFNLATGDWDAANTWADVPGDTSIGRGQCQDAGTGNVYVSTATGVYRWEAATQTYTSIGNIPNGPAGSTYRPMAYDHTRGNLVVFGDNSVAGRINVHNGASWSSPSLTGSYITEVSGFNGHYGHYDAGLDLFLIRENGAGGRILTVHPTTWATGVLSVTGGAGITAAVNGVFGKFQRMPALSGYVYIPRTNSNVWFLAGA